MRIKDETDIREVRPYYFTAYILRNGARVRREGTVNASSHLMAIDNVYEIGKKVWKRVVVEVIIMGLRTGEVLATSTIGEKVQKNLLNTPAQLPAPKTEESTKQQAGFVPWDKPKTFLAIDVGKYFTPETFGRITSFK